MAKLLEPAASAREIANGTADIDGALKLIINSLHRLAHLSAAASAIDSVKKLLWNHLANHTHRPTIPPTLEKTQCHFNGTAQKRDMQKLLVANRSEIAIRVMRAATELGLRTVAVFTHEDRFALHRFKADESYLIGPEHGGEPGTGYLNIDP